MYRHSEIFAIYYVDKKYGKNLLFKLISKGSNVFLLAYLEETLENVKGEFESFGELLSVRETGTESLFQRWISGELCLWNVFFGVDAVTLKINFELFLLKISLSAPVNFHETVTSLGQKISPLNCSDIVRSHRNSKFKSPFTQKHVR